MPKGCFFLVWHDDASKESGVLGDRSLTSSAILYEPQINSGTVQGERTGSGAPIWGNTDKVGTGIDGEAQGGGINGKTRVAELARSPG